MIMACGEAALSVVRESLFLLPLMVFFLVVLCRIEYSSVVDDCWSHGLLLLLVPLCRSVADYCSLVMMSRNCLLIVDS